MARTRRSFYPWFLLWVWAEQTFGPGIVASPDVMREFDHFRGNMTGAMSIPCMPLVHELRIVQKSTGVQETGLAAKKEPPIPFGR